MFSCSWAELLMWRHAHLVRPQTTVVFPVSAESPARYNLERAQRIEIYADIHFLIGFPEPSDSNLNPRAENLFLKYSTHHDGILLVSDG